MPCPIQESRPSGQAGRGVALPALLRMPCPSQESRPMVARPARRPKDLPPPTYGLRLRMSYEEFMAWAPSGMFCEWADGEAIVAMPATELHQRVLGLFHTLLNLFVEVHGLGGVWMGPMVAT